MFENKKFSFGKKNSSATVPGSNNSRDEIDESIPIHTMEKDLASLGLGASKTDPYQNKNISFQAISQETKLDKEDPAPIPEKAVLPSPFMTAAAPASAPIERKPAPVFPNKKISTEAPIEKAKPVYGDPTPSSIKITNSKSIWGRALHISVTVFIILLLVSGGYYYFLNYGANFSGIEKLISLFKPVKLEEITPNDNEIDPVGTTEENEETAPASILFSIKNPNYLNLKREDLNAIKAKEIFIQYGAKIKEQNLAAPVEFIVSDENNNPIGFKAFSAALGMNLSSTILSKLGESFSLFLYNEDGVVKSGLSISSTEDKELEKALLLEEKNLAHFLEPLFLSSNYTIVDKDFSSSSHGDAKIRFINIVSPEDLSVDWTVYKNKLMIGTTKMTLRSIIDYTTQANTTDSPQNTPQENILPANNTQTVDNL